MSSLPLLDSNPGAGEPAHKLVGIAKLAAEGEFVREGHEVEFFTLNARSILNRCTAPYMPFTWTVNPYRGCEFACKYCYARYTHEFMEIRDNVEFERKIFIKQHAAWLLRQDLKKVKPGEQIAIGTATDPYQPAERRYEVTCSLLEEIAQHERLDIGIVTKSDLIVRDLDLLRRIADRNKLHVSITVTTTNTRLARILEPRAPRPDLRLRALRDLVAHGINVGVIVAPVLPGITDSSQGLENLVQAAAEAGSRFIFANPLFLKPCSASVFLPFLEKEFPKLVEEYRLRYGMRSLVSSAYRRHLGELMTKLQRKYGFRSRLDRKPAAEVAREKSGSCGVSSRKRFVTLQKPATPLLDDQLRLF